MYVGLVVFTILPFCPSPLWAQLIARASNWRYVGILVGVWNFIGLLLVVFIYKDPAARYNKKRPAKDILKEVDYVGGVLSIIGITCFMMGMQWGAEQVSPACYSSRPLRMLTCLAVLLGQCAHPGSVHHWRRRHHSFLRLGDEACKIPNVSKRSFQER